MRARSGRQDVSNRFHGAGTRTRRNFEPLVLQPCVLSCPRSVCSRLGQLFRQDLLLVRMTFSLFRETGHTLRRPGRSAVPLHHNDAVTPEPRTTRLSRGLYWTANWLLPIRHFSARDRRGKQQQSASVLRPSLSLLSTCNRGAGARSCAFAAAGKARVVKLLFPLSRTRLASSPVPPRIRALRRQWRRPTSSDSLTVRVDDFSFFP